MPVWLALPFGLLFLLSATGLFYSIRGLVRLNDPAENAFAWPAAQPAFRFALARGGTYELACARPGQFNRRFNVPPVVLRLRRLPAGPEQLLQTRNGSWVRRTDLGGETTLTVATFAALPGEYELLNPGAAQFPPGDRLRILPETGPKNVLLVLAVVATGVLTIGSLVASLIAGLSGRL